MANQFELMAANVCQMLKQLVHTSGVPASEKMKIAAAKKQVRGVAAKIDASAYGGLTRPSKYAR
jgi:hypothetical protein